MSIPAALQNLGPGQHFRLVFVTGGNGEDVPSGIPGGYIANATPPMPPPDRCHDSVTSAEITDEDWFPYNMGSFDLYNNEMQTQWNSSDISGGIEEYLGHKVQWRAMVSWIIDNSYNHSTWQSQCNCYAGPGPGPNCCFGNCIDNILHNPLFANEGVAVYDLCGTKIVDTVLQTSAPGANAFFGTNAAGLKLHRRMNRNKNGLDITVGPGMPVNPPPALSFPVWTGTDASGMADLPTSGGGGASLGYCDPNILGGFGDAFSAIAGDCNVPIGTQTWLDNYTATSQHATAAWGQGCLMYAISDVLQIPEIPHIDPKTIPLVHNRIGVCRPICVINLPGGIGGNVVQPQPIQMSTRMRNVKRLQSSRGWRRVTLEQYNNIKAGKATFLGGCYKKK